jgi:periplasmic protein TonB
MEISKILTADILDILFEGRNKEYGAYDLRKTYKERMVKAVVGMGLVVFLFVGYNVVFGKEKKQESKILVEDMSLEKLKEEKKPEAPPPPPPPKQEPPKVEIAKFTPPIIVKEPVKEEEKPPEVEKLEKAAIGLKNQEGTEDKGVVEAPKEVSTGGPAPVQEDYDKLFTSVQIESEFPGGAGAWSKYLERNLNSEVPKDNGAPAGKYTVEVSFTVDKEGNISDAEGVLANGSSEAFGTIDEAIKVIKKGPKWKPGVQNGISIKSRKKQRITFLITED